MKWSRPDLAFRGLFENFVLGECALGDGFVDTCEILINDAPRPEIEVAYF